jgi:chromosome transmission fidelity protein 1
VRESVKHAAFALRLPTCVSDGLMRDCVPSDVLKLRSVNQINERCLELQKNKKNSKTKVC